jgi:hypothetical protein
MLDVGGINLNLGLIINGFRISLDGDDWVKNLGTGMYEWHDNITATSVIPAGYKYIGPAETNILRDLNLNGDVQSQSVERTGVGIDGDEGSPYAALLAGKSGITGQLHTTAKISLNLENITANNKLGLKFEGVRFTASVLQFSAGSTKDATMDYQGTLSLTMNNQTSYAVLRTPTSYCIPAGTSIQEAFIFVPARNITSQTTFQNAVISLGTLNPALQIQPRPITMKFHILKSR